MIDFLQKSMFALLRMDDQQKGADLPEKRKTRLLTFFSVAILEAGQRGVDLSFSRWRRCYKSRGSFPLYLASEVQKRPNAPVPSQKSATKVSNSRAIPPFVPRVNPPGWSLVSALSLIWRTYSCRNVSSIQHTDSAVFWLVLPFR